MWELSEQNRPISHGYGLLPSLKLIQGLPCLVLGLRGWPLASLRWKILLVNL